MTGFSRTLMTRSPVSRAGDRDVGEQLGRVEVLQRLIERLRRVGLAGREVRVGADRLGLEALVAAHRDRADRALLGRGTGRAPRERRVRALPAGGGWAGGTAAWASKRRGRAAKHRSDHKQRASAPAE